MTKSSDIFLKPLPVAGYTLQSEDAVAMVNQNKHLEEILLRRIEAVETWLDTEHDKSPDPLWSNKDFGYVWLTDAEKHIKMAFMCLNRAVFRPQRIELPEEFEVQITVTV